jgi:hypothetical protein
MMDCRTARQLLEFARPIRPELEGEELEELQLHLAECPECGPLARAERQADEHLGRAMLDVPVPKGLHDRLCAQLRREWWGWNRKGMAVALGVAAAILVVIGVSLLWLWSSKPIHLLIEAKGDEIWMMTTNPRPESIEAAFQSKGLKTVAPPDANYDLLHYYGMVNLQGKDVPFLFFTDGKNDAHLFILPVKVFDVEEAYANQQGMGSGWKAEIRYDPSRQYGYLIIYTGEPLNLFPKKSSGSET